MAFETLCARSMRARPPLSQAPHCLHTSRPDPITHKTPCVQLCLAHKRLHRMQRKNTQEERASSELMTRARSVVAIGSRGTVKPFLPSASLSAVPAVAARKLGQAAPESTRRRNLPVCGTCSASVSALKSLLCQDSLVPNFAANFFSARSVKVAD